MKKIKFLAVALAAITMFSCSKENEVENLGNNAPGESSAITIEVTGEGNIQPSSRVLGPAGTTDVTVNNYIVFLFRDGGALDCPPHYQDDNTNVTISNATTAAKNAYVVANTGALAAGPFSNVRTEDDLKKATGNLMGDDNNTSTQTATNLWMSGEGSIIYGSDKTKGTVTVALGFVAAKIALAVKDNRTNLTGGANITIEDKEVVLLYAGKIGKFFGSDKNVQDAFYSGDISYTPIGTTTESTALSDAIATPFTSNTLATVSNHFYAFGNDGTKEPTIIAIKSTRTVTGTLGTTIYYPVQFTADDAKFTIEPGNSYKVTITLNGDVNAGAGGGTTNPEAPVVSAEVTVTVTPAAWIAKVVDKEFN